MIEQNLEGIFDYISKNWETKKGLLFTLLLTILLYYFLIASIISDISPIVTWHIQIIILLSILILISIIWLFSTNRYIIKNQDFKYVAVSVSNEELKEKVIIRKILKRVKNKINSDFKDVKLCVKLIPFNIINSQDELNKYFRKFDSQFDVILVLNTESGYYNSIEKLKIKRIWSIFYRLGDEVNRKIFYFKINYNLDLNIQKGSKDWNYTMLDDGNDKQKYFTNIYDLILFYSSMHLAYINNFKMAYELILPICDPDKARFISFNNKGKNEFRLTPLALSYARKNNMFIDLSMKEFQRYSENNNWNEAYNVLKLLDDKIPKHKYSYYQKILLARSSYEIGNLSDAIKYTNQARTQKPNGATTYLNYGFFAILENSPKLLALNYNKLYNKRHQVNESWADIIDFLLREQRKKDNNLYNFALGFIYKVFVESDECDEFFENYFKNEKLESSELRHLYDKIYKKVHVQKINSSQAIKKKRKSKRKKKRKR